MKATGSAEKRQEGTILTTWYHDCYCPYDGCITTSISYNSYRPSAALLLEASTLVAWSDSLNSLIHVHLAEVAAATTESIR